MTGTARLDESEDTLAAIRRGDLDAVVVEGLNRVRLVYTLETVDRPYRVLIQQMQEGAFTSVEFLSRTLREAVRHRRTHLTR